MKKIIILISILVIISGCNNKKITCTKTQTEDGVENITVVTATYNKSKLNSMKLNLEMNLLDKNKTSEETFEFSINILKEIYKDFSKDDASMKDNLKDNKYNMEINFKKDNFDKINEIMKINLDTSENFKKSLEADEFTCK